jgi:hypothetical protein
VDADLHGKSTNNGFRARNNEQGWVVSHEKLENYVIGMGVFNDDY